MQRFKQPNMDLHPDGEWIRYADHVEAMKRIAGASAQHAEPAVVRKTFVFDGVRNPDFVPLRIEFEPGYPEDVAFGTQRQMDRLKKWLDKFFAMRTAQSASPAALTEPHRIVELEKENRDLRAILANYALAASPSALTYEQIADAIPTSATIIYGGERKSVRMTLDELREFARALLATPPAAEEK